MLANFIVSLAQVDGPIGEQVRTFVVGDETAATEESLRERIGDLRTIAERDLRYQRGKQIGERLGLILDSLETLVVPIDPRNAFELLVSVIERDGHAMESCGDHDDSVAYAIERSAELIGQASASLPTAEVVKTLRRLVDTDGYGVR